MFGKSYQKVSALDMQHAIHVFLAERPHTVVDDVWTTEPTHLND